MPVVNPNILTPALIKMGVAQMKPTEVKPRLVLCTTAQEKQGKTHFAFTAPGPIGVITMDTGTMEVAETFVRRGKQIYPVQIASAKTMLEEGKGKAAYDAEWKRAKQAHEEFIKSGIRTLIDDTATELYELCKLAHFGKLTQVMPHHYAEPNQEFREFLKQVYETKGLNAVFIHKMKKEYAKTKKEESAWTGKYERAGYGDVPYIVDMVVEHYREANPEDVNNGVGVQFCVSIVDSRINPNDTIGLQLKGDECTFQYLGLAAFPDGPGADPDYWE